MRQEVTINEGYTRKVALGNRTSLCFIEQEKAAQSQREQCRKKTAIIQKDKRQCIKCRRYAPISVAVSAAKQKGLGPPAFIRRQMDNHLLERERKQKPGPKGIIWSITDIPAPLKPFLARFRCFVQFFFFFFFSFS
jgi:hypothetical protein